MQGIIPLLLQMRVTLPYLVYGLLSLVLLVMPPQAISASTPSAEYKLKAALIFKLTHFVEWPPLMGNAKSRSLNICLLGRNDFGNALDSLATRRVNDVPIVVHHYSNSRDIDKPCQLLYISDSKQAFMAPIIRSLGTQPVLTISDAQNFAENGGMIQFVSEKQRIGFRINLSKAQDAGLHIAAPLLDLATIVSTTMNQDEP